jgi:transposase
MEGTMPKYIRLREMSESEVAEVRRLARARQEAVELVKRARLIEYVLDHPEVPATRAAMRVGFGSIASGSEWVKRFNAEGVAGLYNRPKSGRPLTHSEEVRSQVLDVALQKPRSLGYPFEMWTLERLQVALREKHNLRLSRSTIWQWLDDEGLEWKRQESWFHEPERHDPEFVEKRGHHLGVCDAFAQDAGDLHRRMGATGGQD